MNYIKYFNENLTNYIESCNTCMVISLAFWITWSLPLPQSHDDICR
jgi:hypothetical protein